MIFGEFSLSSTAFALDFQGCSIFVCGMCLCGHLNLCVLQKVHWDVPCVQLVTI